MGVERRYTGSIGQIGFCTCASALANSEGARASTALSAAGRADSAASCILELAFPC